MTASGRAHGPLDGRVALVTGGSRGIGRAIAAELARRGAAVAVLARIRSELDQTVAALEAADGTAMAAAADVTDRGAVAAAVEERLGPVDVLVNDAAQFQAVGPLWEVDPDDWWREVEVDLRGPALVTSAVLPAMRRRGGRIVNLVSGVSTAAFPGASAYCAAKTALLRLTETLDAELAGDAVRVFAVDPGLVRTPMNEALMRTEAPVLERGRRGSSPRSRRAATSPSGSSRSSSLGSPRGTVTSSRAGSSPRGTTSTRRSWRRAPPATVTRSRFGSVRWGEGEP